MYGPLVRLCCGTPCLASATGRRGLVIMRRSAGGATALRSPLGLPPHGRWQRAMGHTRARALRRLAVAPHLTAIDADGHIVERESDVRKYLASPWDRRDGGLFPSADQPWDMFVFGKFTQQPRFTAMSPAEEA